MKITNKILGDKQDTYTYFKNGERDFEVPKIKINHDESQRKSIFETEVLMKKFFPDMN